MKPFLLLQSRPEDKASDNEYEGFLQAAGLKSSELERIRVEAAPLPKLDFGEYSGIIVGGSPFNTTDPEEKKSDTQKRVEADFAHLLKEIIEKDFPFFGACYGVGMVSIHQGGEITRRYSEPVGPTDITLTDEAKQDLLCQDVPSVFQAIVGHKEACEMLPPGAVLLASSAACPVQMFRVKSNVYATQFHPELDMRGVEVRTEVYKNAGYFPPEEADAVIASARAADLSSAPLVLRHFVVRYHASS